MNFKKMIMGGLAVFILVIVIISAAFGGFKEPEIVEKKNSTYIVYGISFEGKLNSPEFGELFTKIESKIKQLGKGTLTAVYLTEPTADNNYVGKAIIGITFNDDTELSDLEEHIVNYDFSLYGRKKAHPAFTRIPLNLENYTKGKRMKLDNSRRIEFYLGDRDLAMEIPYVVLK